jgi:hypothetical protein
VKALLALLLVACGGRVDETQVQDIAIPLESLPLVPGGWCCEGIDDSGAPEIVCGFELKPEWAERCYCAGVRSGAGACEVGR